ncbi:MAG: collagenase-like protease, partial [Muribaculaceae bacterium]|nr:collagenase-like protease [Muribaculaceae bacterium]
PAVFVPASSLTALRRKALSMLDEANEATYKFGYRRTEDIDIKYASDVLDCRDNVSNKLAAKFYQQHGVHKIERAMELMSPKEIKEKERVVMTTRYCLRRELGCCKKSPKNHSLNKKLSEPLTISTGGNVFRIEFDCSKCEMNVLS